jgi:hypothetical protein
VESSLQHESRAADGDYEFTTLRIVSLVIAVVLWVLLGFGAMARQDEPGVGYFIGSLFAALLFSWIVRSLFRLIMRRPVIHPAWTAGLFVGAVIFQLLSAAGNAAPPA